MMAKAATKTAPKSDEELQAARDLIDAELGTARTPDQADALFDAAERAISVLDKKLQAARDKRQRIAADLERRRQEAEEADVDVQVPDILSGIDKLIEADAKRIRELREARDRIDEEFRIRARRAQAEKEARKQSAHDAVVAEMMDAEAARLNAVDRFELNFRQAIEWLRKSFDAAEDLRQVLNRFDIERPRQALSDVSRDDFVKRMSSRMSGVLATLPLADRALLRAVGLEIFPHPAFPAEKTGWRDDEEQRFAPVLEEVAQYPVKTDDGTSQGGAE